MKKLLLFSLLLLMATTAVLAQDEASDTTSFKPAAVTIFLKDGTQLRGMLRSDSPIGVTIQTENLGDMIITRDKILRVERESNGEGFYRNGKYWFPNPHSSRYFFAPSSLPLRKGEGYYQNSYLFVNSAYVGVTDRFTMGGGFVLNPTFRDWGIGFLTPKISFPSKTKVTFGAGAIVVGAYFKDSGIFLSRRTDTFLAGIAYGTVTIGDKERNGTVGLGWGFANGDVNSSPTLNLSYMTRLGRRVGFVTENWIIIPVQGDAAAIMSGGLRFFGERMAVDLALLSPVGQDVGFAVFPYVDFVIKFGK